MKKSVKILLIASPFVLIGGYLLYKNAIGKETYEDAKEEQDQEDQYEEPEESIFQETLQTPKPLSTLPKYFVDTLVTPLNVREQPTLTAKVVSKLAKGSIVYALPSNTEGWFKIFETGDNPPTTEPIGFSSASYL